MMTLLGKFIKITIKNVTTMALLGCHCKSSYLLLNVWLERVKPVSMQMTDYRVRNKEDNF